MRSKHAEYAHYLNKNGAYIVPPSVEIDMTNACNQDCTYCNVVEFRNANNDATKIHDYHVLVERVKSWQAYVKGAVGNVNTITFVGGGEPTARKGYEYVVEQAVDTDLLVSILPMGQVWIVYKTWLRRVYKGFHGSELISIVEYLKSMKGFVVASKKDYLRKLRLISKS